MERCFFYEYMYILEILLQTRKFNMVLKRSFYLKFLNKKMNLILISYCKQAEFYFYHNHDSFHLAHTVSK